MNCDELQDSSFLGISLHIMCLNSSDDFLSLNTMSYHALRKSVERDLCSVLRQKVFKKTRKSAFLAIFPYKTLLPRCLPLLKLLDSPITQSLLSSRH